MNKEPEKCILVFNQQTIILININKTHYIAFTLKNKVIISKMCKSAQIKGILSDVEANL